MYMIYIYIYIYNLQVPNPDSGSRPDRMYLWINQIMYYSRDCRALGTASLGYASGFFWGLIASVSPSLYILSADYLGSLFYTLEPAGWGWWIGFPTILNVFQDFHLISASCERWEARVASGHNATTRRVDPRTRCAADLTRSRIGNWVFAFPASELMDFWSSNSFNKSISYGPSGHGHSWKMIV